MISYLLFALIGVASIMTIVKPNWFYWVLYFSGILPLTLALGPFSLTPREIAVPFLIITYFIRRSSINTKILKSKIPIQVLLLLYLVLIWYFVQFSLPGQGKTFMTYFKIFSHFMFYFLMVKTIITINQPLRGLIISKWIYLCFIIIGIGFYLLGISNEHLPEILNWYVQDSLFAGKRYTFLSSYAVGLATIILIENHFFPVKTTNKKLALYLVIVISAIILGGTRGGLLTFFILIGYFGFFTHKGKKFIFAAIIATSLVFIAPILASDILDKYTAKVSFFSKAITKEMFDNEESFERIASGRGLVYISSLKKIKESPFWGSGIEYGDPNQLTAAERLVQIGATHQFYLGLTQQFGIIGLILFLFIFLYHYKILKKIIAGLSVYDHSGRMIGLFLQLTLFIRMTSFMFGSDVKDGMNILGLLGVIQWWWFSKKTEKINSVNNQLNKV